MDTFVSRKSLPLQLLTVHFRQRNKFRLLRFGSTQSNLYPNCVPQHSQPTDKQIEQLQLFISNSQKLLVLTGAGISTESGIPDYRSEHVGRFAKTNSRPIIFQDFVKNIRARQRYWARNYVGWPVFSSFQPNSNHRTLASWENSGRLLGVITQNVDNLHFKAGSQRVTELHGSAFRVRCLRCKQMFTRDEVQELIREENRDWTGHAVDIAPDGDVDLTEDQERTFKQPHCIHCSSGVLQPAIVFFGDNVPRGTMDSVYEAINSCHSLLVLGSSLQVFSGLRIVRACHKQGKPVCIVNIGPTRGDTHALYSVNTKCGLILPQIHFN